MYTKYVERKSKGIMKTILAKFQVHARAMRNKLLRRNTCLCDSA